MVHLGTHNKTFNFIILHLLNVFKWAVVKVNMQYIQVCMLRTEYWFDII